MSRSERQCVFHSHKEILTGTAIKHNVSDVTFFTKSWDSPVQSLLCEAVRVLPLLLSRTFPGSVVNSNRIHQYIISHEIKVAFSKIWDNLYHWQRYINDGWTNPTLWPLSMLFPQACYIHQISCLKWRSLFLTRAIVTGIANGTHSTDLGKTNEFLNIIPAPT